VESRGGTGAAFGSLGTNPGLSKAQSVRQKDEKNTVGISDIKTEGGSKGKKRITSHSGGAYKNKGEKKKEKSHVK